jgi:hypothetical protein
MRNLSFGLCVGVVAFALGWTAARSERFSEPLSPEAQMVDYTQDVVTLFGDEKTGWQPRRYRPYSVRVNGQPLIRESVPEDPNTIRIFRLDAGRVQICTVEVPDPSQPPAPTCP